MSGNKELFYSLDESQRQTVRLGDDNEIEVAGKGSVAIQLQDGQTKLLQNVQFVPNLAHNLLSVGQLMSSGYAVIFEGNSCSIKDVKTGIQLMKISRTRNNMFPLEFSCPAVANMVIKASEEAMLWHERFGHLSIQGLQILTRKNMVLGMPKLQKLKYCDACFHSKLTRQPYPSGVAWRAKEKLQLVHADLCGPMQVESMGGSRYFFLLIDDFSRMSWTYFIKSKDETFNCFQKFLVMVERETGLKLKTLRTDRGGEFISNEFRNYCEKLGIKHEFTAPYSPQQNGIAERKNRTLVERARSMMKSKHLPIFFWAEAIATVAYLSNLSPTRAVRGRTPYEAWRGSKPSKFDDRAQKTIFIGYSSESKAYRLFDPETKKVVISRNVVFCEEASWEWKEKCDSNQKFMVPWLLNNSHSHHRWEKAITQMKVHQIILMVTKQKIQMEVQELYQLMVLLL